MREVLKSPPFFMAESEGFEPPVPRRVQQISSLPRSTTPAALQYDFTYD